MWSVAACLLVVLVASFAYLGNAQAYSWAAVVEALSKQPVIQLRTAGTGESQSSWLSITTRKAGQQSDSALRFYDFANGFLLERGKSDLQARRFRLPESSLDSDSQRLVLAFLAGGFGTDGTGQDFQNARLVEENWSLGTGGVELRLAFATESEEAPLRLTLTIDPKTQLPHRVTVHEQNGTTRATTFSYPREDVDELVAKSFPAELSIVDVAPAAVVASETSKLKANTGTSISTPSSLEATAASNARLATPLTGAASLGWQPLVARNDSGDGAVTQIDALLERLWREQGITPVAPATDEELLRRVYLDLTGRTPTVMEVRNYLADNSLDRYAALVDRLLASRDHATHLAAVWRSMLLPEGVDLTRFGGIQAFDAWLSDQFAQNVPYDKLASLLLLAEGRLSRSGPLLFYSALKLDADQLAGRTARVFLGMRLDCAQCHDDPFEPWTQQDFWSFAAFFARISRPQAALESVSTVMQVRDIDRGEVKMPGSESPVMPKFLDGSNLDESPQATARREQLVRWLASPENPYFARAAVNRVWAHLFGQGIVDPVDGFGKRHPPRSAELLDLLASRFIANDFNLRDVFRVTVLSRAYRLSSGAATEDPQRREWFAQMNVKMLTAEQVYDCISVASMLVGAPQESVSIARVGNSSRDEFLQQFKTIGARATEYQSGIPQALTLMNGSLITGATGLATSGLLKSLDAPFFTDDQRIEVLYLATLSRRPGLGEWDLLRKYVADRETGTPLQEALADILWGLLNSAEFTMNH
jgi:hypothetical protein